MSNKNYKYIIFRGGKPTVMMFDNQDLAKFTCDNLEKARKEHNQAYIKWKQERPDETCPFKQKDDKHTMRSVSYTEYIDIVTRMHDDQHQGSFNYPKP